MDEPWFRRLGFNSNPFSIKPAAFHSEIVGYKLEPLVEKIKEGSLAFVEAPLGSGKTTILRHLIGRFGGRKQVIHVTCLSAEHIDTERLLRNARISGKLFGRLPHGMILLVDEAGSLEAEEAEGVLRFVDSGNLLSVVFFGTRYQPQHFPARMRQRLAGNLLQLSMLTPEQAVELVRKRIGSLPLLSDDIIRQVYVRANYSPRRLLEVCEDVCRHVVESAAGKAAHSHIDAVLGALPAKRRAKAPKPEIVAVGTGGEKQKRNDAKVVVRDISVDSPDNFNLNNIRTYEEEMALVKPKIGEEKK